MSDAKIERPDPQVTPPAQWADADFDLVVIEDRRLVPDHRVIWRVVGHEGGCQVKLGYRRRAGTGEWMARGP